jgi:hypothetical protein
MRFKLTDDAIKSSIESAKNHHPIDVNETQYGLPMKINNHLVTFIKDAWRPKRSLRSYWSVVLASGQGLVIFKNEFEKKWYEPMHLDGTYDSRR